MIPNPILKVLSSIQKHRVRALLMGGQACVLYGAAEFSRDTDLALLASPGNLERLQRVLDELRAQVIAVPAFDAKYLKRGHAVHFRCWHPDVLRLRIDVMAKMRGVAPFATLWKRRTSVQLTDGSKIEIMNLADLVQAKKTQRAKDWPMIQRLLEAHYYSNREQPTPAQIRFWLKEMRTPELLIELVERYPKQTTALERVRPLLKGARRKHLAEVTRELEQEERHEREKDRRYWTPLKRELERLRRERFRV